MNDPISQLRTPQYRAQLDQCIHCGMCLESCPSYTTTGHELDSPRGRIALMRTMADGTIELDQPTLNHHLNLCLSCRACETACPSGVQYGALYEQAHQVLHEKHTPSRVERLVRWAGLKQLMPHVDRLKLLAVLVQLYQRTGLQKLVRSLGFLPPPLKTLEGLLPHLKLEQVDYRQPAPARGQQRGRVAFLYGCVQEAFLSHVNAASVRVLQHNGYEVYFPQGQTCCGAAHRHVGEVEAARDLARRNIDACLSLPVDAIISNAGGCGAELKDYPHLLSADPVYAERAKRFAAKVQDISEFLAAHLHVTPTGHVPGRAVYIESCHLRNVQKVTKQPRELLQSVPGLTLVELAKAEHCCGSAGTYNITQVQAAQVILDAKMADVAAARPDLIVVSNTGCHLQVVMGARQARLPARVLHIVEVLDESYRASRNGGGR
jgi:glycolate oxidase iron-sulfur subunit